MKYTIRKASDIITGNQLIIVECNNGLTFYGDNAFEALDSFLLYYGL